MEFLHGLHAIPSVTALCGAGNPWTVLGISLALFTTGVFGGFGHCAPMCGPFVLLQLPGAPSGPMLGRLGGALLPGYHLGRLTTYVGLGTLLGALGGALDALAPFRWGLAALLGLASLVFLLQAMKRFLPLGGLASGAGLAQPFARLAAPLLQGGGRLASYALGIVLGFLPCGFLYAALAAAGATGSAFGGAAAMAGFALGTVPALAVLGLLGASALHRFRRLGAAATTPVLLLNAATLAAFALSAAA